MQQLYSDLATILSQLYPRSDDQFRIAQLAGLDTSQIRMEGAALAVWFEIVRLARLHGLVDALLLASIREFPEVDELARIRSVLLYLTGEKNG